MEVNVYIDYYSKLQVNRLENLCKNSVLQTILLLNPNLVIPKLAVTLGKINYGRDSITSKIKHPEK